MNNWPCTLQPWKHRRVLPLTTKTPIYGSIREYTCTRRNKRGPNMNKWHLTKVQRDNYQRHGPRECNTQDRKNQDMQWFCTSLSWPAQQHGWRFQWSEVGIRHIYQHLSKNKRTKGKSTCYLPCQGHYLNSEYFSEESLECQDNSRTNNASNCKDYIEKNAEVVIASPDTVIFLMMVQMYPSLPCDIIFLTGKGNLMRNIPVQPVYNK